MSKYGAYINRLFEFVKNNKNDLQAIHSAFSNMLEIIETAISGNDLDLENLEDEYKSWAELDAVANDIEKEIKKKGWINDFLNLSVEVIKFFVKKAF